MSVEFPETLSTREASRIVRRHPRTVARWVRAGKLAGTYDPTTGLTLVYAEPLLERLRAGEAANRPAPVQAAVSTVPRVVALDGLTDEEWRARFAV
jgi:hypothetical protein